MKAEQLYQHLKELAEKMNITVSEQSLRHPGIRVKSGLCRVKDRQIFIMDKSLPTHKKNRILASCLSKIPHEEIYILPAVRKILDQCSDGWAS